MLGKTLGEGTFGKVKLAVADDGEKVAIKILDKESIQKQKMGTQVKREISIMKALTHRHVVNLKEVLASRSKIFLVRCECAARPLPPPPAPPPHPHTRVRHYDHLRQLSRATANVR